MQQARIIAQKGWFGHLNDDDDDNQTPADLRATSELLSEWPLNKHALMRVPTKQINDVDTLQTANMELTTNDTAYSGASTQHIVRKRIFSATVVDSFTSQGLIDACDPSNEEVYIVFRVPKCDILMQYAVFCEIGESRATKPTKFTNTRAAFFAKVPTRFVVAAVVRATTKSVDLSVITQCQSYETELRQLFSSMTHTTTITNTTPTHRWNSVFGSSLCTYKIAEPWSIRSNCF